MLRARLIQMLLLPVLLLAAAADFSFGADDCGVG